MAGLDLGGDIEFRGAHHLGGTAGGLAVERPGRIVQAGVGAARHQFVIGGMKLDLVEPETFGIEDPQFRRVFVGEAATRRHFGRTPMAAEFR